MDTKFSFEAKLKPGQSLRADGDVCVHVVLSHAFTKKIEDGLQWVFSNGFNYNLE